MATGTVNAAGQAPGRALTGGSAGIGKVWSAQNSTAAALAKGTVSSSGWNNVMSGNLTQNNGTNISAKSMDPFTNTPTTTTTQGNNGQNTTISPAIAPVKTVTPGWPLTPVTIAQQNTKTNTQAPVVPTLPWDVFGAAAIAKEKTQPWYIDLRNTKIWTTLQKAGVKDEAGVKQFLETQPWFTQADPTQQANTIANVVKAMGITPAQQAPVLPAGFVASLSSMAKASGFNTVEDMKAQLGSDFSDLAQYYPTDNDPEKVNLFNNMLQGMIAAKRTEVGQQAGTDANMQAIETNYWVGGDVVASDWKTIQNWLDWWLNISQIASTLGKPVNYVTDLLQGKPDSLPALSAEQQTKATQYLSAAQDERQTQLDAQRRDASIALQNLTQDYTEHMAQQTAANQQTDAGMSHIAAATGAGMTNSGIAAIDYAHQQGLDALTDIQKTMDRGSVQIANQLNDAVDVFNYNTKVYNMYYKDAVDSAKSWFFNEMQKVQTQAGSDINAYYTQVNTLGKTFLDNMTQINKDRADLQMKLNEDLQKVKQDAIDNNFKQQTLDLQKNQFSLDVQKEKFAEWWDNSGGTISRSDQIANITNLIQSSATPAAWVSAIPDWTDGGQCWYAMNNVATALGSNVHFNNTLKSKVALITPWETAKVWDFIVMDTGAKLDDWTKAGHVWFVTAINPDWTLQIKDSNWSGDGKILSHPVKANDPTIKWYVNPAVKAPVVAGTEDKWPAQVLQKLTKTQQSLVNTANATIQKDPNVAYMSNINTAYKAIAGAKATDLADNPAAVNDLLMNIWLLYNPKWWRPMVWLANYMSSNITPWLQEKLIQIEKEGVKKSSLSADDIQNLLDVWINRYNDIIGSIQNTVRSQELDLNAVGVNYPLNDPTNTATSTTPDTPQWTMNYDPTKITSAIAGLNL